MKFYILQGHDVVETQDLLTVASVHPHDNVVDRTVVEESVISTVFFGIDLAMGRGEPLFFETLVFTNGVPGFCRRYSTWDEAEKGHKNVVRGVKNGEIK